MSLPTMPDSIDVKDLENRCSKYYADKMQRYDALYEGGEKFDELKRQFLPKRPIEKASNAVGGANAHYESRLDSAFYTNYAGGTIDWFSAKVVQNNPRIKVNGGVTEESRKYWESLNTNADGLGNPLITLCRWAAREVIVNLRSYLSVNFKSKTDKDGRISLFDAVTVDDWDEDAEGTLQWIRRHTSEDVRSESAPWEEPEMEAHYWTFYDDKQIVVYKAEKKKIDIEWPAGTVATKQDTVEHEFGDVVFDVRSDRSLWIMDRIEQPIVKLFRREASLNWYLDSLCYQMPVLNLNNTEKFKSLPVTPLGALVLEENEKASFLTPSPGGFEPNFKAVEQAKTSLYESIQILAKEAASIPQAGRLSGEAVEAMQKPMEVLIGAYAWPIEDALVRLIEGLKKHRNESSADIVVEGFGRVKIDESELAEIMDVDGNKVEPELDSDGNVMPVTDDELNTTQDTVLNGAQVTAAVEIVSEVATGRLPRESGVHMLMMFFNLSAEEAESVMGTAGTNAFEPEEDSNVEGRRSASKENGTAPSEEASAEG